MSPLTCRFGANKTLIQTNNTNSIEQNILQTAYLLLLDLLGKQSSIIINAIFRHAEINQLRPSATPEVHFSDDMGSGTVGSMKFRQDVIRSPEPKWAVPKEHYEDLPTDQDKYFKYVNRD